MSRRKKVALASALLLAFWIATTALQYLAGAFDNELGGHPDEAAHYVTGLMVLEYVSRGLPANPMAFAQDYYDHYPKVALGHYPPGFYILSTIWSAFFSPSPASLFLFLGFLTAATATVTSVAGIKHLGTGLSVLVGSLFVLNPLVQEYSSILMSDMAVAGACLLAILAFSGYLETGRPRYAVAFGLFASAAIMTKASGLLLALVPPFSIALALRWRLLRQPSLWVSGLLVGILCLPWMLLTYRISSEGMVYESSPEYTVNAIWFFTSRLVKTTGWALAVPALVGLGSLLVPLLLRRRGLPPFWASMISLLAALVVFYSIVPIDMDRRYLIPALPPALLLTGLGIKSLSVSLASRQFPDRSALTITACACTVIILFFLESFTIPRKSFAGFSDAADTILAPVHPFPQHVLVSSDPCGEGAFIAEIALRYPAPRLTIHRASKALATSNWIGRDYALRFETQEELRSFLESSSLDWLVVDDSLPDEYRADHHTLLEEYLCSHPASFVAVKEIPLTRNQEPGRLILYRRRTPQ